MSPNTGLNTRSRAIKTARIGAPRPEYPVDRDRRAVSVPVQILVRVLVGDGMMSLRRGCGSLRVASHRSADTKHDWSVYSFLGGSSTVSRTVCRMGAFRTAAQESTASESRIRESGGLGKELPVKNYVCTVASAMYVLKHTHHYARVTFQTPLGRRGV
jgi:hypothetical protein